MLGLGIALLIGMVGASLWLVEKNDNYSRETADLRRIRSAILDVLTTLQDAETGQRGYLLTRREDYLAPYREALQTLAEKRERLVASVQNKPIYTGKLPILQTAIDAKIAEIGRTIDLVNAGRIDEAIDIVRADTGLIYMQEIRNTLDEFQDVHG